MPKNAKRKFPKVPNLSGFSVFVSENGDQLLEEMDVKDCHMIIDGSNIQHHFGRIGDTVWTSGFHHDDYYLSVKSFFERLREVNVTPHVILDGSNKDDERLLERTISRRQERLVRLQEAVIGIGRLDPPSSVSYFDIFRDYLRSENIDLLQSAGSEDYSSDIVFLAEEKNAFVVSESNRFCLQEIPRGYIRTSEIREKPLSTAPDGSKCIRCKVYKYEKFQKRFDPANDRRCKNPNVIPMFYAVASQSRGKDAPFFDFSKYYLAPYEERKKYGRLPLPFNPHWCGFYKPERVHPVYRFYVYLLAFLSSRTADEAKYQLLSLIGDPEKRKMAHDHFKASEDLILTYDFYGDFEEKLEGDLEALLEGGPSLPKWFVQALTTKASIPPGVLDCLTGYKHFLFPMLENIERPSSNAVTLRIRRLIYAILFGSGNNELEDNDLSLEISEFDRVDREYGKQMVSPLWVVADPLNEGEKIGVVALRSIDGYGEKNLGNTFLVYLNVPESFVSELPRKSVYAAALLRYWTENSEATGRLQVITYLVNVLLIEAKLGESSPIFPWPVKVNPEAEEEKELFWPADVREDFIDVVHSFSELQNIMSFAKVFYRLLREPFGSECAIFERFMNLSLLMNISYSVEASGQATDPCEMLLEKFVARESVDNFNKYLNVILP